jgi:hypothetical protein
MLFVSRDGARMPTVLLRGREGTAWSHYGSRLSFTRPIAVSGGFSQGVALLDGVGRIGVPAPAVGRGMPLLPRQRGPICLRVRWSRPRASLCQVGREGFRSHSAWAWAFLVEAHNLPPLSHTLNDLAGLDGHLWAFSPSTLTLLHNINVII